MSEELQAVDMELKDLFIKQDFEGLLEVLDQMEAVGILEIHEMNWGVVKKYYDLGRKDLLRKHLNYVAFSSFLTEYAGKKKLYEEQDYQLKFGLFEDIYQILLKED